MLARSRGYARLPLFETRSTEWLRGPRRLLSSVAAKRGAGDDTLRELRHHVRSLRVRDKQEKREMN
eukprot:926923-Pleurochrysis_carterae.AAC.1